MTSFDSSCDVGNDKSISSIPDHPSIGPFVSDNIEVLKQEKDAIEELDAGKYYGESVDGITTVDTTNGDVILGVEEPVRKTSPVIG